MPDPFGDAARPCIKCGRELPAESFSFHNRAKGTRKPTCKDCVSAYSREHYNANRDVYIERAKLSNRATRADRRTFIAELKSKPCTDCGRTFHPCIMEFDHVGEGRTIKGSRSPETIGTLGGVSCSLDVLMAELAKTELVCANCHRLRTYLRRTGQRGHSSRQVESSPQSSPDCSDSS
jgi:hypothetical protein